MMALGRWPVVGALVAVSASVALARPAQERPLVTETWTVDGVERSALVAEPHAAPTETASPLVLVFHGHGGSSANAARTFRIHDAWPEAVVIYPQGLPTMGEITDPHRRSRGLAIPARDAWRSRRPLGRRDARLGEKALQRRQPAHTFAAGHSNGGSMVYVLWAARAGQIRGVRAVVVRISSRAAANSKTKPKPAFIVAGREDALVPFALQQFSLDGVFRVNQADRADQEWSGARGGTRRPETDAAPKWSRTSIQAVINCRRMPAR